MTNTKSTKRALISSVVALFLCFAMLIGTTFAWFTDSVASANNIIKSGNLDIVLEYWDGDSWEDVAGKSDILTNTLWEPGVTEIAYFRIANAGSLALKYQFGINIVSETAGVNAAGETFKLSDYIQFGVVEGVNGETGAYANRDAAVAAVTDAKIISAGYNTASSMVAGQELYLALVVYMPTTVGNEANHDGVNVPEINLGINIFATQLAKEEDSFGPDYDFDAPIVSVPVARPDSAVTLKGAEDVMITLSKNVIDALPAEVTEIGMLVSEPKVDGNTITFDSIELIDQNGEVIDLEALNLTEKITVILPAQDVFAPGATVVLYHDGEYVATAVVKEDKTISYEVEHLCEVTVGAMEAPVVNGDTVEIANVAQLISFAQSVNAGNSYAGKTVVLTSDIDLNNIDWTPIGSFDYDRDAQKYANAISFMGTFDGQSHTIYNLKAYAPNTDGVALFGCVEAATIKNVNVHNVDIVAGSHAAPILARGYNYSKTTTVTNCHVTGNISIMLDWAYAGGIVAKATGLNISDCSVLPTGTGVITAANRNAVGGIVGWVEAVGASTIKNCNVANMNLTGWANIGAINGYIQAGCKITDCSAENIVLTKTRQDGHPTIGLVAGGFSYNATQPVTITNNTVTNISVNGTHIAAPASANILYGAEFSGNANSNFVLDNNTTANVTNNLIEVEKITDGIVAKKDGTKLIYNANGLKSLSGQKISGNYELVADIDLGGAEFKAMSAWYASATFNGNGYTISNAKVVSGDNDNGMEQASMFFVSTSGALTVSDLILKDIVVATENIDNGYAAAVVGYCEGSLVLNNVDVVNASITGSKSSGMLVGHLTPAGSLTATDCDVAGSITISSFEASGHYAGEYVGTIAGNTTLTNCTADVTLGGNLKNTNAGTIYGRKVSGTVVVNGATVVTSATEMATAVAAGVTSIYLADGEYDIANCGKKTLTISGSKNAIIKIMNEGENGADYGFDGSTVTFNGVTVDTTANTGSYKGYARMTATFNDCAFVGGGFTTFQATSFNNCTFDLNGYIWTWGATEVNFTECTFIGDSRTILAHGSASTVITVKDCDFAATTKGHTGSGDWTAAVEIDPTGSNIYTINFEGTNTMSENYSGWTRVKDNSTGHIITGLN